MVELTGRNAIVTGAAMGVGKAYAIALAEQGVNVAVCDMDSGINNVASTLESMGVQTLVAVADVANPDDVRKFVDDSVLALGGIDILINNAGQCHVSHPDDDLEKSLADYETMIGTNLKGEYLVGRAVIDQMLKQGGPGDIVNIATDHMVTCGTPDELCPRLDSCPWANSPRPSGGGEVMDIYDASKWGLNGLLFAWAKALKPYNIRVNGICMGATDSHMIRSFYGFSDDEELSNPEAKKIIDTWMTASDSAQVVIDLLKEGPEGRTARNMNLCIGRQPVLEPALPHIYILEEDLHAGS
ncbi:MAG: SDR family oxidoreductase [bacterium]|nr:SDR family oxidoreductase [Gammaproteobacteria bacterium]